MCGGKFGNVGGGSVGMLGKCGNVGRKVWGCGEGVGMWGKFANCAKALFSHTSPAHTKNAVGEMIRKASACGRLLLNSGGLRFATR